MRAVFWRMRRTVKHAVKFVADVCVYSRIRQMRVNIVCSKRAALLGKLAHHADLALAERVRKLSCAGDVWAAEQIQIHREAMVLPLRNLHEGIWTNQLRRSDLDVLDELANTLLIAGCANKFVSNSDETFTELLQRVRAMLLTPRVELATPEQNFAE